MNRRQILKAVLGGGTIGISAGLGLSSLHSAVASGSGYKALVVLFLNGGNDGNDVLVPIDGAYSDYQKARPNLIIPKTTLAPLGRSFLDHQLGLNPGLRPLLTLFNQEDLAFIVNTGPLIEPSTPSDVLNGRVKVPPFLLSHPEQTRYVQGWTGDADPSGWGGRAIERISPAGRLVNPLVSLDWGKHTVVNGQRSRLMSVNSGGGRHLGRADLMRKDSEWTQIIESISRLQSSNPMQTEFSKTFRGVFSDGTFVANALDKAPNLSGNFANDNQDDGLGRRLSTVAKLMPFMKAEGATRQIFSIEWGSFDTHTEQRALNGNRGEGQDVQLSHVANALTAFQQSIKSLGLENEVVTLVCSEFGRSLNEGGGGGTDHAWGSHWMVMGAPVSGGRLYGTKFPRLILGGPDDGHQDRRGYWVPQFSSDQVAADLLTWLGLSPSDLASVMPNLANFRQKTVGFMNG